MEPKRMSMDSEEVQNSGSKIVGEIKKSNDKHSKMESPNMVNAMTLYFEVKIEVTIIYVLITSNN